MHDWTNIYCGECICFCYVASVSLVVDVLTAVARWELAQLAGGGYGTWTSLFGTLHRATSLLAVVKCWQYNARLRPAACYRPAWQKYMGSISISIGNGFLSIFARQLQPCSYVVPRAGFVCRLSLLACRTYVSLRSTFCCERLVPCFVACWGLFKGGMPWHGSGAVQPQRRRLGA